MEIFGIKVYDGKRALLPAPRNRQASLPLMHRYLRSTWQRTFPIRPE